MARYRTPTPRRPLATSLVEGDRDRAGIRGLGPGVTGRFLNLPFFHIGRHSCAVRKIGFWDGSMISIPARPLLGGQHRRRKASSLRSAPPSFWSPRRQAAQTTRPPAAGDGPVWCDASSLRRKFHVVDEALAEPRQHPGLLGGRRVPKEPWIKDAVEGIRRFRSNIRFKGWSRCTSNRRHPHLERQGWRKDRTIELGNALDSAKNSMNLDIQFKGPGKLRSATRSEKMLEQCERAVAAHEMGLHRSASKHGKARKEHAELLPGRTSSRGRATRRSASGTSMSIIELLLPDRDTVCRTRSAL